MSDPSPGYHPHNLVIHRAHALTADGRFQVWTVVASGGRIVYAGAPEHAPDIANARHIDGRGATLLPGLIDCHGHLLSYGESLRRLDVQRVTSFADLVAKAADQAAKLPPGSWLQGRGWDSSLWGGDAAVDIELLSQAVPAHPVFLKRHDGHAAIVNHAALRIAGVTALTPDPPGGMLARRYVSNAPRLTGLLIEAAASLVSEHIPALTTQERRDCIALAGRHCLQLGLTGVFDALDEPDWLVDIDKLLADGIALPRVHGMWRVHPGEGAIKMARNHLIDNAHDARLSVKRWRMVLDGGMGARGARFYEPYCDAPDQRGFLMIAPAEVAEVSRAARAAGASMCVHAIGDEAIDLLLDAWEPLLAGVPPAQHRFMIEHCVVPTDAAIQRISRLGIVASVQPLHTANSAPWVEQRIGPLRAPLAYAYQRLRAAGVKLVMGSDVPVASADPRLAWRAGVTREYADQTGRRVVWQPQERLTLAALLHGYTQSAAWAAFREADLGALQVGARADMVLFDGMLADAAPDRWPGMVVRATLLDGRVVYEANP